ncbi:class I SAM-dependent methyltransferase [Streptomyces radicis]|uniref:Class I SAM-dependent methyltransferase n=2 Tax=Streptomyces radicis TaxID=1750517 RepID=A0A3A9WFM2_9ACTN|nr:class I SAM-dependent methyltransferase [Streptomyces radicis]RKN25856.1 class I SAM-dependent methyltransferase [Streptomyces radicis]
MGESRRQAGDQARRARGGCVAKDVFKAFLAAKGFMPPDEGRALHAAAVEAAASLGLPLLEIGSYCGRSTLLLADAARAAGTVAVTVDHHRGSEEQQPGQEFHDRDLADPAAPGRIDTLPFLRRTLADAHLEEHVIAVVGRSARAAAALGGGGGGRFGLVFIDGGHTDAHATADFESWSPQLAEGGLLVIHDVFPDPADGGQAPYRVWRRALDEGAFAEVSAHGSLRVLRRVNGRSP